MKFNVITYVVLNPKSKVAELTDASTELSIEDIEAYAQMINNMYKLPVMYIEYSGTYGNKALAASKLSIPPP